jgi:thiol:disulfide interchange protein DsbD
MQMQPFTLLAIFPSVLSKMPKSGGWLNAVKVFFAFILLAFALMFLSNLGLKFVTRDIVLALDIVIFALLGLYLLGKIKFSHDSDIPYISVPRLILAIISFSIAVYLIPGLFGSPLKAVSPFLPAFETSELSASNRNSDHIPVGENTTNNLCDQSPKYADFLHLPHGLQGYFDYNEALSCAKEQNKPVLVDFVGHSCKNCKKMYAEVWSDPKVLELLRTKFIIAALYTDDRTKLPEEEWVTSSIDGKIKKTIGKKNVDFEITKFNSNALPLYAILNSSGEILTSQDFYTYSPGVSKFIDFLNEGIRNHKK